MRAKPWRNCATFVEVEGDDVDEKERWQVRVLATTAFALAGEVEEALETLGVGTNTESLEVFVSSLCLLLIIDYCLYYQLLAQCFFGDSDLPFHR